MDGLIEVALNVMQVAGQVQQAAEGLPVIGRKRRSILSNVLLPNIE